MALEAGVGAGGPGTATAAASARRLGPVAWRVAGLGLAWGALAAGMLHGVHWGLNLLVVLGAWWACLAALPASGAGRHPSALHAPMAIALLAAAGQAWRASPHLRFLDGLVVLAALAWPLAPALGTSLGRWVQGATMALASSLGGALSLLALDLSWQDLRGGARLRDALAVGLGLALALPLLLIFGGLMAMADAGFEALASDLLYAWPLKLDLAFWALVWAWPAWGYGRWYLAGSALGTPAMAWAGPQLGARERALAMATALALVDALFAAFVALQLPRLFGGATWLASTPGLTAAEYARRGFFELSLLAGLALPALVLAQQVAQDASPNGRRLIQALSGAGALLLAAVLASAAHRMGLYAQLYGLTVARVEVLAAEAWGAIALVVFAATVLRWRPAGFWPGISAAGLLILAGLHLWPMELAVVRHDRAQGIHLDEAALWGFSADVVPELVAQLPPPGSPLRLEGAQVLLRAFHRLPVRGWADAHWAEGRAREALAPLAPLGAISPPPTAAEAVPAVVAPPLRREQLRSPRGLRPR